MKTISKKKFFSQGNKVDPLKPTGYSATIEEDILVHSLITKAKHVRHCDNKVAYERLWFCSISLNACIDQQKSKEENDKDLARQFEPLGSRC